MIDSAVTTACRLLVASESGIIGTGLDLLIKGGNEFGEITQTPLSELPAVVAKSAPDIILVFAPRARQSIVRTLRKFSRTPNLKTAVATQRHASMTSMASECPARTACAKA